LSFAANEKKGKNDNELVVRHHLLVVNEKKNNDELGARHCLLPISIKI